MLCYSYFNYCLFSLVGTIFSYIKAERRKQKGESRKQKGECRKENAERRNSLNGRFTRWHDISHLTSSNIGCTRCKNISKLCFHSLARYFSFFISHFHKSPHCPRRSGAPPNSLSSLSCPHPLMASICNVPISTSVIAGGV